MTIIQLKNTPGAYKLVAIGHAGKGEGEKENLVCAAVSILTQALVQFCRERSDRAREYSDRIGEGDIFLRFLSNGEDLEISGAFRLLETGLDMIEQSYPGRIQVVKIKEE